MLKKYISNPKLIIESMNNIGLLSWVSDEAFLKWQFKNRIGTTLDLENPLTFNEKLQWLKLNDRNPEYIPLVDKYEVREFISNKIGDEYLIPLIDSWNNVDEINWDKLPNQFVLKGTHDSGGVVVCKDKTKLDIDAAKKKIEKSLSRNYFNAGREWPYKYVAPQIIAEKYLEDQEGPDLKDYKLMVFNGEVKCTLVASNRSQQGTMNVDFFDLDWNHLSFGRPNNEFNSEKINKPEKYNKMIELAERLAENMPFVRVDFYEVNGEVFFGEMTFYPASGFEKFKPEKYDRVLGDWLDLSEIK